MITSLDLAIMATSKQLGISSELVEKVYKSYWKSIRQLISELPLKNNLTEEEFSKLKTSINIPSLGKLYSTYNKVEGIKRKFKYLQQIKNNDKNKEIETNVH